MKQRQLWFPSVPSAVGKPWHLGEGIWSNGGLSRPGTLKEERPVAAETLQATDPAQRLCCEETQYKGVPCSVGTRYTKIRSHKIDKSVVVTDFTRGLSSSTSEQPAPTVYFTSDFIFRRLILHTGFQEKHK